MADPLPLDIHNDVAAALRDKRPVVALESALITHGLPSPMNVVAARAAAAAVRAEDATPATIGVLRGCPVIGLTDEQLEELARDDASKAGGRDLAAAIARGRSAGTTVSGTMVLAHLAGIRFFATGGIGGAHPGSEISADVSADLIELGRTPVAVICAGAKSILDIPRTLEILETHGVPVVGYRTTEFPAFFVQSSGELVAERVEQPDQFAAIARAHWRLGGRGLVLAQPVSADVALRPDEFQQGLREAERQARQAAVRGPETTPFLLNRLAQITEGKTLRANHALIVANARLAAQVAKTFVAGG
jgi:pseudouridylate synthase